MKNLRTLGIYIIALTVSVFGQTMRRNGSPSDNVLERPVPGTAIEYFNATDAFRIALGRSGVPGGTARILDCPEDDSKQSLSLMNEPLHQVLDRIVEAEQRYRWQFVDQVIDVLPATGEPALLQTYVKEFQASDVTSAREALNQLLNSSDVKRAMDDLHLKAGIAVFVSSDSLKPFSVNCKGVSLRQVLNAIARAQGRAVWDYVETHCDGKNEVVIRF